MHERGLKFGPRWMYRKEKVYFKKKLKFACEIEQNGGFAMLRCYFLVVCMMIENI